jgi:hypothetical protein
MSLKKLEPAAISKLRTWKAEQLAEIKKREDALAAELRAAVPDSFSVWLEEDGDRIIEDLFEKGRSRARYSRVEIADPDYGYTDLKEFKQRFRSLKTAWAGIIKISTWWDGDDRFAVTFTVI